MRRVLLVAQLALLAVGLSACGGDTLSLDPVASAATKTVEAGSSRVEFDVAMTVAGESIDMTGSGVFDYNDPRGSLTFRMELPEVGDMRMEMRMLGTKMYMRMPEALGGDELPNGKEWIGFDLAESLEQLGLGGLDFAQQQDPAQVLRYLRAAGGDLKEAGYDEVRGVDVTRYVGRMDIREALDAGFDELGMSPEEEQKARKGMQQMLDQLGTDSIPVEVFVDDAGLLRRMTMELAMTIESERMTMSISMDFFDFGIDVDVEAPPASSVLDVTDALQPQP